MVRASIYRKSDDITGFCISGHADDYAEEGHDVVCAGISALVINAVNSVEQFTSSKFSFETAGEEGGRIAFSLEDAADDADTQLLLSSMVLGLSEIEQQYGNEYLTLEFKEV